MTTPRQKTALLAAATATLALLISGCAEADPTPPGSTEAPETTSEAPAQPDTPALPDWTLGAPPEDTDAALAWQALMGPDGEYAALASYQAVLDEYGQVEPYARIMVAESRHADALIRQLERMDISVPDNPYLGLIDAPVDLESAATAWAAGEVANVELYDELIDKTSDERLIGAFENLRRASAEDHLPAFELAAENGGVLPD